MDILKKGVQYFFDGTPFKVIYFILTFLSFNSFTANVSFMPKFAFVVTALGGIVLLYRVIYLKRFIKTPNLLFLGLFLVSFVISALVNWKYGVFGNVKGFIWMAFQFCILYACDDTKEPEFYKREFHILSGILLTYLAIGTIISLYFLITAQGAMLLDRGVIYGFIWQRLWGTFTDPNIAGTLMCVGIFVAFYLFKVCQQLWIKIGCWFLIALYSSYILFSDSRTAMVCLMAGSACIAYLLMINPNKRNWKKLSTQVIAIGIAIVVGIGAFYGVYFAKKGYNFIQTSISYSQLDSSGNPINTQKPNFEIGRPQDLEHDISNRRFSIWISGAELFKASPVFGIGFRNIVQAAEDKVPDTYIVNNDQGKFDSFHNVLVDVLASQGIVGVVIILTFIVLSFVWLLRLLVTNLQGDYVYIAMLFSIMFSISVASMFLSDILYVNTHNAFIFWTVLGYLMHYAAKKRKERIALNKVPKNENTVYDQPLNEQTMLDKE